MLSVETVIVGGGIAGLSTAYWLATYGAPDVLVLEQNQVGSGATRASAGGVRQQFSTELEIRLSIAGLRFWKQLCDTGGMHSAFQETGYLLITSRPTIFDRLADAARLQASLGAGPAYLLTSRDIARLVPWINATDLAGGCLTPEDGRIDVADGLAVISASARRKGVRIEEGWPVERIQRCGDKWRIFGKQVVSADRVVVAAGVWTTVLLRLLEWDVGVRPWLLHYGLTDTFMPDSPIPSILDLDSGISIKREGLGLCVGLINPAGGADTGPWKSLEDFAIAAEKRAPSVGALGVRKVTSGIADMSIDGHPYAGPLDEGLWVLAGFCGHGTMHAPVVAELLVKKLLGVGDPDMDISVLHPLRSPSPERDEWMVAGPK